MQYCDGMHRRDLLKIGTASLLGGGVTLPQMLGAAESGPAVGNDKSVIYVFLKGGISTIDTWDMKPDAPAEFRGDFNPIATNMPGTQLCEHLPRMARQMDKIALVRSFAHHNSDHGPADHYMLTGYFPQAGFNPSISPNNQRPSYGSIISKKLGPRGSVPPYVCLPRMHASAGSAYLGSSAAPFVVEADPNAPNFSVPDLMPPLVVDPARLGDRKSLLKQVDRFQQTAAARSNHKAETVSVFQQKAFDLMTSTTAQSAFDIHQESAALREEYGRNSLGQSCLMARRLVEAGVRCVTIDHTNWDTHENNFAVLKDVLLPYLDGAISTLLRDLQDRGLLEKTLVLITGEFGRTPRINKNAGRDHWGPSSAIALAGGGIQGGRVVGASNERAEKPITEPFGPEDLSATMFHLLGINPEDEFYTPEGRPIKLANNGKVMSDLL